ncbi:MAG: universal stress protein [Desulfobaccales bacterium]
MFKTIVLATDLSPAWDEIVACAGEFKALGCSRVILTNVIVAKFLSGLEEMLRADVRPKLETQQRQLEAQGLQVEVEIPFGLPAYSLNDIACRYGADLIVVGSHGTALWREAVLGCFTCAVVHHSKYPTLLINVRVKKDQEADTCRLHCGSLLRHVLFPTDFSEIGVRAGEFIEILATRGIGQVTLLNTLDVPGGEEAYPPGYQEIAEGAARQLLEKWKQRLLEAGVPVVNDRFDSGHPIPAILQVLESQDISLIVMGTQGKGFIKEIFLGSVAHNVSRLATCPVLLIPPVSR